MLYLVIQSRWIRNSHQNGENIVAESTRKREARGLVKQNFHSHLDMLITHKCYGYDEFEIDEENYSISLGDSYSIAYNMRYYIKEVDNIEVG